MTRTCLYTRISTDEENQPTSLASQHERLEAFCRVQEDWRIVAYHEDRATGTKLERPGLQAALDLARQGRIDQLLLYRIDRLSRKVRQLASIAEELDRLGVILRSATEPFDTGSVAGRMMLQMLGVFAEFEHATIVDRVTSGIERRAREGRWPNGRIPFGYARNEQKQLIPDERTAPVIRRIFKWYAAGRLGAAAIARRLDAEHAAAPPRGWQPNIMLWVLSNQAYVGQVHWRDQTFPSIHEPLIDQDTFNHAQALLKERGEDLAMRAASRAEFLLTGLVRCGRCRRAYVGMSAKGNDGTYHYYACSGRQKLGRKSCDGERLPKDKLETEILHQLTGLYRHGGLIRDAIEEAAASNDTAARHSPNSAPCSPGRSPEPSAQSSATKTPSRTATSPRRASSNAYPPWMHASMPSKAKTKHSPVNSQQRRPQCQIQQHSKPSPTISITPLPTASPSKPRPCSQPSSPTCVSTAAKKSCPPTASAHPRFARRTVQWV
jgi:site-specific DNA recombinase